MTAKNSKYGSQHLTVTFSFKLSKFSATSAKDFLSVFIKGSYFVNDFKLSIADFFILFYYISNPFLKTFLFFPFAFPLCVCVSLCLCQSEFRDTSQYVVGELSALESEQRQIDTRAARVEKRLRYLMDTGTPSPITLEKLFWQIERTRSSAHTHTQPADAVARKRKHVRLHPCTH